MTLIFGSEPDYMTVSTTPASNFINRNVAGKFRADNRLYPNQGNFIIAGQSNSANAGDAPLFNPTNSGVCIQINPFDGGTYLASDPLLGCGGDQGNLFTRVSDKLIIAGKYSRVNLIPCGIGSTGALVWATTYYDYIILAYRRAEALGIPITAILWQQGETDNALGNTGANWIDWVQQTRAKVVAAGCTAPWMIAKSTYYAGTTSASIRASIDTLWTLPGFVQGPDTDVLTGFTYRNNPDNVHFNVTGLDMAANLWRDRIVIGF